MSATRLLWSPWKDDLCQLVSGASASVDLAVAYISKAMVSDLLATLPDGVKLRVVTRLDWEGFRSRVVDPKALRLLDNHVRVMRNLHAKMYIVDEKVAVVGSANLTKQGLSFNQEAGLLIEDASLLKGICARYDTWWKQSEAVKHDALAALAKKLPPRQRGSSQIRSAISRMAPVVRAAAQRAQARPEPGRGLPFSFPFTVRETFLNHGDTHPARIPVEFFDRVVAAQLAPPDDVPKQDRAKYDIEVVHPDRSTRKGNIRRSKDGSLTRYSRIRLPCGVRDQPCTVQDHFRRGQRLCVEVSRVSGTVRVDFHLEERS